MKHTGKLTLRRAVCFGIAALICAVLPAGAERQTPAEVIRAVGFDQRLEAQVPLDLVFRDETGTPVALRDYFHGKPVVLSLVYYDCPMLCTLVLNGLVKSLRATKFSAGNEFTVLTVSFDPRETPALAAEKKRVYIQEYKRTGAEAGWHFLTGDEAPIRKLTDAVGFRYTYDAETKQFAHASGIVVLTPEGKISRYLYGIEYSARDLRLALVESAAGKIGNPVDQVLLYCYHYDPVTGKYGAVIMNIIRVLGSLTVLLLAGFMVTMLRRERRGVLRMKGT